MPYCCSSVCVADNVLLAIGGSYEEEIRSQKTSDIYAFHPIDIKWLHVGELPFKCCFADTLLLSNGKLLVADGDSRKVVEVTVTCKL